MSHDLRQQRRPVRAARGVSPVKVTVAVVVSGVVVVALFAAGIAAERFSNGRPADATATSAAPAQAAPRKGDPVKTDPVKAGPAFGEAVRDGKFEFAVTRVDCSSATVSLKRLKRTADGKFCIVGLTVRNIGDGSKYFLGRAQTAYDTSGATYDSDELAGLYVNGGAEAFLQKLGPGEKVSGKLVFDVPERVQLDSLELHDSPLSGGVKAPLRDRHGR
ncbi:hypothetical protein Ait01nite_085000 [Actinoplanes italicus]|uniref:Uncharacterized protein DUF4352 n=1 Tax=Actinoplanes italicus TaxID=113567 RepID=A0A2T0JY21_9ACTN|nr:DUF4352 domain-containing protein [Actinoplanes italicus]PRX12686.1 uncharacterized protein DUF4352 [Actinoplanes italicus]GIE35455.1 hypothetical protein Ait01nite_085000 [Actinoplanes italicus]